MPASAVAGSTITAVLTSNRPNKSALIEIGRPSAPNHTQTFMGVTNAQGSFSHSFTVEAGDTGQTTGFVDWQGDTTTCAPGHYTVT